MGTPSNNLLRNCLNKHDYEVMLYDESVAFAVTDSQIEITDPCPREMIVPQRQLSNLPEQLNIEPVLPALSPFGNNSTNSISYKKLTVVLEKLQKINVYIHKDSLSLDYKLLDYLCNFLSEFKSDDETIFIRLTDINSPSLVKGFLSKTDDKLRYLQINQTALNVISDLKTSTFQEHTNALFRQLLPACADPDKVAIWIKKTTGGNISSYVKNKSNGFRNNEIFSLATQIMDLPEKIIQLMNIKEWIRAPRGSKHKKSAGTYSDGTITLFDSAFRKGNFLGSQVFLHEMGHGVWENICTKTKNEFEKICWENNQITCEEFINSYSGSNIKEDFAEHFAFYLHNPLLLKQKCPKKYAFLKKHIFDNIEYFHFTHKNLKFNILSETPDVFPPYFKVDDSQKVTLNFSEKDSHLTVQVNGLYDDISGVQSIFLRMFGPEDYENLIYISHHGLTSKSNGSYKTKLRLNLNNMKSGTYFIEGLEVTDKSGNAKTVFLKNKVEVFIAGTAKTTTDKALRLNVQAEKVILFDGQKDTTIKVTIPTKHLDSNLNCFVKWIHEEGDFSMMHHIRNNLGINSFLSKEGDSEIVFFSGFQNTIQSGTLFLNEITCQSDYNDISIKTNNPIRIPIDGVTIKQTEPQINVDKIKIMLLKNKKRSISKQETILINLPIEGIEEGFDGYVKVTGPTGNINDYYFSETEAKKTLDNDGTIIYQLPIELLPNLPSGEYTLSTIGICRTSQGQQEALGKYNVGYETCISDWHETQLIERGIREPIKFQIE